MSENGRRPIAAAGADFDEQRRAMVNEQLERRGIRSPRVLEAMADVPRHLFVPPDLRSAAYTDQPLAIGESQTIAQPFMVAAMAEALELQGTELVLEVGTGCGYQAAVLSLLAREVYTIEFFPSLAREAQERLKQLGYANVRVVEGDGSLGWPPGAPYDAILVTAAAPAVPPPLLEQLAEPGRLVVPVGSPEYQVLRVVHKVSGRTRERSLYSCRFVPLLGRHGWGHGHNR